MIIQRISTDFNYLIGVSSYERNRLMIMGNHVERLFFGHGFDEIQFPNCSMIHLAMSLEENKSSIVLPSGSQANTRLTMEVFFNKDLFFSMTKREVQVKYILDLVLQSLLAICNAYDHSLQKVNEIYKKILNDDMFISFIDEKSKHHSEPGTMIFVKNKCPYDSNVYKLDYFQNGLLVKSFDLCTVSPLYLPTEHNGYPKFNDKKKVAQYADIHGWINDNEFEISYAHKRFIFKLDVCQLEIAEFEDLKEEFINWGDIH